MTCESLVHMTTLPPRARQPFVNCCACLSSFKAVRLDQSPMTRPVCLVATDYTTNVGIVTYQSMKLNLCRVVKRWHTRSRVTRWLLKLTKAERCFGTCIVNNLFRFSLFVKLAMQTVNPSLHR